MRYQRPVPVLEQAATLAMAIALVLLAACSAYSNPSPPATGGAAAAVAAEPVAVAEGATPAEPVATVDDEECPRRPPEPPCEGGHCTNTPFVPSQCWTTEHGPARADVFLATSNFLYCQGGTYALCFYSGPPDPTGNAGNPALPCTLQGDGLANCTCEVFTSGAYFVDINAILNLGAWYETVEKCDSDGHRCKNLDACGQAPTPDSCPGLDFAPVCTYVRQQSPDNLEGSLIPGADVISAFSFALQDDYKRGQTGGCNGEYAGCMTAPCYFQEEATRPPSDGDPIQCMCPTYSGDFQVGQPGQQCTIDDGSVYVWSAANRMIGG